MTAQLVSTSDGHYLWSEAWDRSAADLLSIEQEIAQAIVNKLRVDSEPESREGFFSQARNPESHTLYLKGRYFWNQRTPEALRSAVACLKEAVEIDPSWPLAWAGLADAHAVMATYNYAAPAASMKAARASALKALSIDANSGEAMTCLAFVRAVHDWEWEEAGDLYRRAIACSPSYATAHHWYGSDYLAVLGRFEEAIEEVETAIRLDPLSTILRDSKGLVLLIAGRYDEAIEVFRALLKQDPTSAKAWSALARLHSLTRRYDEAFPMFEKAIALAGNSPKVLGAFGQTLAWAGQTERAREILQLVERLAQTQYVGHSTFALIHLGLGERARALDHLERGVEEREMSALWLNVHPAWDELRSDPACRAILKRARLS
jgi:tetratricopeptide (TPR) repeat protein